VLLVDITSMEHLHVTWMQEPGPTDVLAFPMDELDDRTRDDFPAPTLLGDVVLCPEVAAAQARTAGHDTEVELHLLCTHGVLHLLGFDHAEPDEEATMKRETERVLTSWRKARA
jgi:probable rRNA maturation factor